jgi:hypothetical protein
MKGKPHMPSGKVKGSVARIALMSEGASKIFSETFNERFQVAPF